MPVRRRSRSSMAAIEARPDDPMDRRSSSSASMPGAMTPPSARVRGGSGTRVEKMTAQRSSRGSGGGLEGGPEGEETGESEDAREGAAQFFAADEVGAGGVDSGVAGFDGGGIDHGAQQRGAE